jgi:hypothetical protein
MQTTDCIELEKVPDAVASATASTVHNAAHLAGVLSSSAYPPYA